MKKTIAILALMLTLALAACTAVSADENRPDPPPLTTTTTTTTTPATTTTAPPESSNPVRVQINDVDIPAFFSVEYHESERFPLVIVFKDTHELAVAHRAWTARNARLVVKISSPSTHIEGQFRLTREQVHITEDFVLTNTYHFTQTGSDTA